MLDTFLGREPVLTATVISSVLGLFIAFGLGFTGEQVAAIMVAVYALLGWIVRRKVSPV